MISLQLNKADLGGGRVPDGQVYDVAVLGGGPAGLTAGLYAARAGLKTLLLERQTLGGQVATTDIIENYPCCPEGIAGPKLMSQIEEQARRFGVQIEFGDAQALSVEADGTKVLHADTGDIRCRSLVVATGAHPAKLGVPGEREFQSHGVSYCATCDGPFYQGKTLAVVGGGDSALQEALYLTRFAEKVYVVHRRDSLRAQEVLQQRAFANPKIEFLFNRAVERINGNEEVEGVTLKDLTTGEREELAVNGVFVYVGQRPNAEFLRGLVELDAAGYVVTDEEMRTSVPGVLAAGDVRHKVFRQMVTAASDGATAANSADHYLESQTEVLQAI